MKSVVKYLLLALGCLLTLNTLFLSLVTNFNIGLLAQGTLAAGLILYALGIKKFGLLVHLLAGTCCLVLFGMSLFLFIYGQLDNAQYDEDVVIVLGAGIRGATVSLPLASRLDEAIRYHQQNPRGVIVVSGGQGYQEEISEAEAMERYLLARGVPKERIIKETNSTSTYENFVFSKEILDKRLPDGYSAVLITNDFHVYRATKIAQRTGISAKHLGAPIKWYIIPVSYAREILAVAHMWVFPPSAVSLE